MTAPQSPYWTTEETAAFVRRPVGTLRQWRHTGRGPRSVRLAGRVVYRREDVEAWVAQQEHASAAGGA
jgi:hypothetical protein